MMKQTITTTTVQTTTITSSPKPASRADRIPKKSAHQIDGLEEEQSNGVFHRKPTPSTPTTTTSLHCSSPVLNKFSHTSEVSVRSSPLTSSTRTIESNNTNQLRHPTKPHELPQPKQYQPQQQQHTTTGNESDSKIHLISSPFSQIHWIRKVKYLEKMKHYDEAIVALLFAMSESTERSIFLKLYLRANIIYNQLKDNDAALRTFNTCTRLYDNIIGLFARAILYLNTEKYEESLNDFDQLVCEIKCLLDDHENDPTLSFKYTNLLLTAMCCKANLLCCHMAPKQVNINSTTTEHQQGHEDYKILIESNSLFKQGLDLYDESLSIDSSFPLIYFYRGSAFRIFNIERTLQDYERAIRIQPDAMLYTFRAALYEDSLCNYRLALLDYNKAIEWEPNEPSYYLYRGHLYTSLMNNNTNNEEILSEEELDQLFQLAIADYTTCIELSEWNDNEEHEQQQLKRQQHSKTIVHALNEHWLYSGLCSRGKLYENRNDTNKALQDFNRAIEIDCREPKAYVLRAMLYKSLNENGMSRSDMQIAMQLEDEY